MVIGPDFTRNLLTGPLSAIANTINQAIQTGGSVANNAISTSGSVQNNFLNNFFGFANNLTNRLFQPPTLRPPFAMPTPFPLPPGSSANLNQSVQNLSQALQGMQQNFQQLLSLFGQLLNGGAGNQADVPSRQPFFPQPLPNAWERFLERRVDAYGDRAVNLTEQAMELHQESAEMRQARALVDAAGPLLLTNNPIDQMRGERMLAQAKKLASEDPRLGQMIDQVVKLTQSPNPVDHRKAELLLNQTENRMGTEAFRDSFAAQQKLQQASQMIDRMMQFASLLAQTQQFAFSSYRY